MFLAPPGPRVCRRNICSRHRAKSVSSSGTSAPPPTKRLRSSLSTEASKPGSASSSPSRCHCGAHAPDKRPIFLPKPTRLRRQCPERGSFKILQPRVAEHGLGQQVPQLGVPAETRSVCGRPPSARATAWPWTAPARHVSTSRHGRSRSTSRAWHAQVQRHRARIGLLKHADDLLVRRPLLLHPSARHGPDPALYRIVNEGFRPAGRKAIR